MTRDDSDNNGDRSNYINNDRDNDDNSSTHPLQLRNNSQHPIQVFYPTHQFYLNDQSIYLIVFKLQGLNEGRVEYWLKQIKLMKKKNGTQKNSLKISFFQIIFSFSIIYFQAHSRL